MIIDTPMLEDKGFWKIMAFPLVIFGILILPSMYFAFDARWPALSIISPIIVWIVFNIICALAAYAFGPWKRIWPS